MKIIDILNKIANGEQPPKKIAYNGTEWEYIEQEKDYSSKERNEWLFDECIITEILNDYVEILEPTIKQDKKIEKLNILNLYDCDDYQLIRSNFLGTWNKINEIIDVLNNLK